MSNTKAAAFFIGPHHLQMVVDFLERNAPRTFLQPQHTAEDLFGVLANSPHPAVVGVIKDGGPPEIAAIFWYQPMDRCPEDFGRSMMVHAIMDQKFRRNARAVFDAWYDLETDCFPDRRVLTFSGIRRIGVWRWFSKLPYGQLYWTPLSFFDNVTQDLADYWEYIIHPKRCDIIKAPSGVEVEAETSGFETTEDAGLRPEQGGPSISDWSPPEAATPAVDTYGVWRHLRQRLRSLWVQFKGE